MNCEPLKKVCKIYNGNSINADFKKKNFAGRKEGYPFIATKDVSFSGSIDYDNGVRIPYDTKFKIAPAGSIFICAEGGSAGRKIARVSEPVCFGNKLFCLVPGDRINSDYLYHYLLSDKFQSQFKFLMSGLIGGVSAKKFGDIFIEFPSPNEQKSIVAKLDAAFAKIEKVKQSAIDQLNETVNLYQAILRDSFKPQKSWKERSFKELGETKVGPFGSLLHQKDYVEGGIPLVNPMHIAHGHIITDSKHCVSLEKYKELSSYVLKEGDIVIGRRGEMGRCAQVTEKENGFLCGTGSIFFRPNKKLVNTEFLTVLLCSDAIKKEMESLSGGATMMNLSSKALGKLTVTIPDVDVQREIMGNISTINNILESVTENASKIYADCEYLKESILRETFI
ncbi:MAG: restriction endonuclease subunit S [Bacteroidales bacterium]|nr:restriction endonuclease subunit S [Bacteroidales bacterium]